MLRFIHSSDLHLGKRFGSFSGDLPGRLREARHAIIARLAQHARDHGASTILLAGDTFDTETPEPAILSQALTEMRHHAPINWVILPGNHDSLQATELWAAIRRRLPANVTLATDNQPIALAPDAFLLPAPCTTRRPGRDLTEWMDSAETPDGAVRIGLAHGPVQNFSEEGQASEVIAPDRARRAGLDYLALGDWHGAVAIDARTRYCGTPEPDRFKHERPGEALLVSVDGPNALPDIQPLPTASFTWRRLDLHLLDGEAPEAALAVLLPEPRLRRHFLAEIVASGRCGLAGRTALKQAADDAQPDFAFLELDELSLATECAAGDLDRIDRAGALREAADALLAESADERRSAGDRAIAEAALARLYFYAQVVTP